MDTGQTEDDAFNPKPIDPELDDSEQLTGESIQPYLSLVGGQVTALPKFRSTPRKVQRIYGYAKRPINFHWIQFKYYLNEMLSKHWNLLKILPMTTNLLMTCGPTPLIPRSTFMETPITS